MGIIGGVLATAGMFNLPLGSKGWLAAVALYVVLGAHAAIALGTLSGGWRIVHTMGSKITKLRPIGGFFAETGAAITLAFLTLPGTPGSTTPTLTRPNIRAGAARPLSAG